MKKFLLMLLAVLFCTSALCTVDVHADNNPSDRITESKEKTANNSNQNAVQNINALANNMKKGTYSEEEVYLTAQLVYHEAHNQEYNGKVAIAEVVLNRVNSKLFPNSVEEVLYQKGQFAGKNGLKNCEPTKEEIRLTSEVLNGSLRVFKNPTVMYFRNPKITNGISAKTVKNWGTLKYFACIGEHAFYSQTITSDKPEGIPTEALNHMARAKRKNTPNRIDIAATENAALDDEELNEIMALYPEDILGDEELSEEEYAMLLANGMLPPVMEDALSPVVQMPPVVVTSSAAQTPLAAEIPTVAEAPIIAETPAVAEVPSAAQTPADISGKVASLDSVRMD